jgi:hypothetical protein
MSIELINLNLNKYKKDFWLHRYFPFEHLNDSFTSEKFNLRFTRINEFPDGLEGWDYSIPNFKKIMKILAVYNNRVKLIEGATIIKSDYISLNIIKDSLIKLENKEEIMRKFEINRKGRQENFASCWFASEYKNDENRVMWQLYANKKNSSGLMISVKWSELKIFLDSTSTKFIAGFVDYSDNQNEGNVLFKKEHSYSHENEFRIMFKPKNNNILNSIVEIKNEICPQVVCTIWDSHKVSVIKKELESLGFKNVNDEPSMQSKRYYTVSNLVPEFI